MAQVPSPQAGQLSSAPVPGLPALPLVANKTAFDTPACLCLEAEDLGVFVLPPGTPPPPIACVYSFNLG